MDGDSENCCRLHGLRHEQREAQHGGGGGGDDVQTIYKQFSKGGPLEKSYFFNFSKSIYLTWEFHMGSS